MSKEYSENTWFETDARGVLNIGFRQQFLEEVLSETFHVVQADMKVAKKGKPLVVLETNDGTKRVPSPISGTILSFSDKARNFPDRLEEGDVIVSVLPTGVTLGAEKVRAKASKYFVDEVIVNEAVPVNDWVQQELVRLRELQQVEAERLRNQQQPQALRQARPAPVRARRVR